MELKSYQNIPISAGGGTYQVQLDQATQRFRISGTAILTSSWTIEPQGAPSPLSPIEGMEVEFHYYAQVTSNTTPKQTMTVFGYTFLPEEMAQGWVIKSIYSGGAWRTFVLPNYSSDRVKIFSFTSPEYSAADIKNLFTSNQLLVEGLAGYYMEALSATCEYTSNGTPYDTFTDLGIITETADAPQLTLTGGLDSYMVRVMKFIPHNVGADNEEQLIIGKGLNLTAIGGNPQTGDGTIKINLLYRVWQ